MEQNQHLNTSSARLCPSKPSVYSVYDYYYYYYWKNDARPFHGTVHGTYLRVDNTTHIELVVLSVHVPRLIAVLTRGGGGPSKEKWNNRTRARAHGHDLTS